MTGEHACSSECHVIRQMTDTTTARLSLHSYYVNTPSEPSPNMPPAYSERPLVSRDAVLSNLARRMGDFSEDSGDDKDSMIDVLLLVLGIVFLALVCVSSFFFLRRYRLNQAMRGESLPTYNDIQHGRNPHGLTIETTHNGRSSTIIFNRDGKPMLANPSSPPHSPDNVPAIHITFPDEQDDQGRAKSGRVLVVRVGDNASVGLEPMEDDEQLPAYEKEVKGQFYSVDMDKIGGLKDEKDRDMFH